MKGKLCCCEKKGVFLCGINGIFAYLTIHLFRPLSFPRGVCDGGHETIVGRLEQLQLEPAWESSRVEDTFSFIKRF